MIDKKLEEDLELKREENLYKKLPLLIKEIILDSALPFPTSKHLVESRIKQIKKITNAECESALDTLKQYNYFFRN